MQQPGEFKSRRWAFSGADVEVVTCTRWFEGASCLQVSRLGSLLEGALLTIAQMDFRTANHLVPFESPCA